MKNRYIKEFPKAFLIGIGIFFILTFINILNGESLKLDNNLKLNFLYTMLYTISLHIANTSLFIFLDKVFVEERFSKKRIFTGFILSFLVSLTVIFLLRIFEDVVINGTPFISFINNEKPTNYIVASVFTFIVISIVHIFYLYKFYQENKLKEQKIIAGTANAKFESLKNQIDPHFLFNSLNVLSSLIEENPDNAQKFTTSLSKIYRYVLEQKDKELVTVQEELTFAKTYMNLLKMRFENSLTYELPTIELNVEAKVVPLSLQLLLENCVKHNVVSEQKPLHIKIYLEESFLVIENNLQIKEVLGDRKGVGLENIISRYAIISKRKMIIEKTENYFKVKLPILTKQVTFMENQTIYSENNAYFNAKQKVEELKGFYGSLISYCVVIPFLIFINFQYSSNFQWFWFPAFGWGIGLVIQALKVYGYNSNWEERKIQEILKNNNKNQSWK